MTAKAITRPARYTAPALLKTAVLFLVYKRPDTTNDLCPLYFRIKKLYLEKEGEIMGLGRESTCLPGSSVQRLMILI